jgi:activator of 2-hydroxyglutaryl-CoA dehydratase
MCTVFAESEVISLLATGADRQKVARGIHQSVIRRAISLLKRVGIKGEVAFVGGVAHNIAMKRLLEDALNRAVLVPSNPQIIGALGCTFAGSK